MQVLKKTVFSLIGVLLVLTEVKAQCPILPAPVAYEVKEGQLQLPNEITISGKIPKTIKSYLEKELLERFDIKLKSVFKGGVIQCRYNSQLYQANHNEYLLQVGQYIGLDASNESSMFHGVVSLLQLISGEKGNYFIRYCWLMDYPRFSWRGLHLDVSRHFFTVAEVKRYIDLMALYKFNTFHWHLTDDQGWRIEIKKYPKLTEIGAWRDSTVNKHYSTKPRTYTVERYGGFYTQEQIKEVVKYAQDRYITVVPEIELPGHSRAALAAYPQFSCTGKQQGVPGLWGVFDDIYCSKKETIDFLKEILGEVVKLFPGKYIHIGGDEAPKDRWKACAHCQQVIKDNHLKDEHELQSYVIRQMDAFLTAKGKRLIGWDEILEGGLSPNATVMSWRGIEGGIVAATQDHDVVMTPGSHCYFDHYQSDYPGEPLAIGGFTPLEKVYQYEPVPAALEITKEGHVLGAQANLWTEYIPDMKQLEYMTYPRAIALAQVLWCEKKPEYKQFWTVLVRYHLPLLEAKKVNFSRALFQTKMEIRPHEEGVELWFEYPNPEMKPGKRIIKRTPGKEPITFRIPMLGLEVGNLAFNLTQHAALGLPVSFQTEPNSHYNNNKTVALVDGVRGRRPWNGKEWLGFDTSRVVFTIDLLQSSDVRTVQVGMLSDEASWIYLPERVFVSVSEDGIHWNLVMEPEVKEETILTIQQKGRFVKIELESGKMIKEGLPGAGHQPWTFLDEVLIDYQQE